MSYADGSGERVAGDVARSAGAGLVAVALGGLLTGMLAGSQLEWPQPWGIGVVLTVAAMTALSYRHVGALVTSGAVLSAIGAVQFVVVQGLELLDVEAYYTYSYSLLVSAAFVLGAGCVLLGAGAGWAHARSGHGGRWAQYEGLRLLGAVVGGGLATGLFFSLTPVLVAKDLDDFAGLWWILPVCAVAALALGAVLALSPTGVLPALIGLVVLQVLGEESVWTGPVMSLGIVLLAAAVHFIGPVGEPAESGSISAAWEDWISGKRADTPG